MSRCPVDGCLSIIPKQYAFCKTHWFMLPKPMRDDMWRAHKTKDRIKSLELLMAALDGFREKESSGGTRGD